MRHPKSLVANAVKFTQHARERMSQRGIDDADVVRTIEQPFLRRDAGHLERLSAPAPAGAKRRWLTVIVERAEARAQVVTAYFRGQDCEPHFLAASA